MADVIDLPGAAPQPVKNKRHHGTYTPERLTEMTAGTFGTDVQRERGAAPGVLYVRGMPVPAAQIAAHLTEYGMKMAARGRYVPVVRNAPVTLDKQGQNMLFLDMR